MCEVSGGKPNSGMHYPRNWRALTHQEGADDEFGRCQVGSVGAGVMGIGMVNNLLKAGVTVSVFNRTRAKAKEMGLDVPGLKIACEMYETLASRGG